MCLCMRCASGVDELIDPVGSRGMCHGSLGEGASPLAQMAEGFAISAAGRLGVRFLAGPWEDWLGMHSL